ncbi:MAG: hypothetical protein OSJ71_17605, partial [Acetatifactor sp.]|nr:hypothetical protein [Acetatifactor sp.]
VLKAGKFDCAYLDNGVQYTAGHLGKACAKLGIRIASSSGLETSSFLEKPAQSWGYGSSMQNRERASQKAR